MDAMEKSNRNSSVVEPLALTLYLLSYMGTTLGSCITQASLYTGTQIGGLVKVEVKLSLCLTN
jgi:hypothetical protein